MENNFSLGGAGLDRAAVRLPATRALVGARAHELAELAGRVPPYVTQADYQQAKRELTGETDPDRQDAILDTVLPPRPPGT